jgi:Na+-driven multidrug efflux pump
MNRQVMLEGAVAPALAGLAAQLFPEGWMHIFTREPEVVAVGAAYLVRIAPLYAFMGLGMALYFASQGAGRMLWPFSAGVIRLATVLLAGSYWIHVVHGSITGLFWIVAASQIVFGGINVIAMAAGHAWKAPSALQAARA